MKKRWMLAVVMTMLPGGAQAESDWLARYNVAWETPSQDSLDSMPLSGRRGAGANVWVQDGSIWLYLAHNAAYDEQGRLLKLGCLRITPVGVSLGSGAGFRQTLDLASGRIVVRQDDSEVLLWFAGETLIIESKLGKACPLDVAFGTWRDQPRKGIRQDMMGARGDYTPDHVKADTEGFTWFHRNADHPVDVVGRAKGQGIAADAVHDATTKRVFGGAVAVDGGLSKPVESPVAWQFWEGKAWTGRTAVAHHACDRRAARCGIGCRSAAVANRGQFHARPCRPRGREGGRVAAVDRVLVALPCDRQPRRKTGRPRLADRAQLPALPLHARLQSGWRTAAAV